MWYILSQSIPQGSSTSHDISQDLNLQKDASTEHKIGQGDDIVEPSLAAPLQPMDDLSEGELEEDSMDICRSDGEIVESTTYGPKTSIQEREALQTNEMEEVYEPPNDIGKSPELTALSPIIQSSAKETEVALIHRGRSHSEERSVTMVALNETDRNIDLQMITAPSHNLDQGSNGSEDGEYEPPEPVSLLRGNETPSNARSGRTSSTHTSTPDTAPEAGAVDSLTASESQKEVCQYCPLRRRLTWARASQTHTSRKVVFSRRI